MGKRVAVAVRVLLAGTVMAPWPALAADGFYFRGRPKVIETVLPDEPPVTVPKTDPTIAAAALPDATVGSRWSYDFSALLAPAGSPAAWGIDAAPSWLTIDEANGIASGVPVAPGAVAFKVEAMVEGSRAERAFDLAVSSPVMDVGLLAGGLYHTCAVLGGGSLWCVGDNSNGQLGDNTQVSTRAAVRAIAADAVSVSSGRYTVCAVLKGGRLDCWGNSASKQVGPNTSYLKPTTVVASGISSVSVGQNHVCAVRGSGELLCWGDNTNGQVGDGSFQHVDRPRSILPSGVTQVEAGRFATCALHDAGKVSCWGVDSFGTVGNGPGNDNVGAPVEVIDGGATSISLRYYHACAVMAGGEVKCWGQNDNGQAGAPSAGLNLFSPVTVSGLNGVKAVHAGRDFTCMLGRDGSVYCRGNNTQGQWGNGSAPSGAAFASGVVTLRGGEFHACAILADGETRCWGRNDYGQLGDRTKVNASVPVRATEFAGK